MHAVLAWLKVHKVIATGMLVVALVAWNMNDGEDQQNLTDSPAQPRATAPSAKPTAGRSSEDPDQDRDVEDEGASAPSRRSSAPEPGSTKTTAPPAEPKPEPKPKPKRRLYAVLDVVDGDTVKVAYRGGESVRIIGIDTPETVHPSEPVECWGPRASAAATRILSGRRVGLVFDSTQGRRDAYDRLLAYVHVAGLGDFGLAMVRRGHAVEYTYDTFYAHRGAYLRAEADAKAAKRGLWRSCGGASKPLHLPGPEPEPAPAPARSGGDCEPGYDPCVPPHPPDVDCADVDGPIRVTGEDPHGLDRDGDQIACE